MGVVRAPLRRAGRRRAAGVLVERRRAAGLRAHRRGRHGRRLRAGLSPWAVRNIRFDESLGQLHGYDFDFCLQVREAGRKVVTADFKVIHHHSLELVSNPETWIEAHMRVAEKWDGRMPGVGVERRRLEAARPARRGRGGRRARAGGLDAAAVRRARRAAAAGVRRVTVEHELAADRAAAPAQRAAKAAARRAATPLRRPGARRISLLRDDGAASRCPRVAQPREPLGERERARVQQPPQHASWRAARCCALAGLDHVEVRRGEVQDAVGLQALEQRVAVPAARAARPARRPRARRAARRRRGRRTRARPPGAGRRARRRSPRPRSARRCAGRPRAPPAKRYGQAAGAHARLAGEQAAALADRLAVLGRDRGPGRSSRRGARAASRRRGRAAAAASSPGALGDQPQLLADRVVVVVAVDDRRVRAAGSRAAPRGSSRGPAPARARSLVELRRARWLRRGIDRPTRARRCRPPSRAAARVRSPA